MTRIGCLPDDIWCLISDWIQSHHLSHVNSRLWTLLQGRHIKLTERVGDAWPRHNVHSLSAEVLPSDICFHTAPAWLNTAAECIRWLNLWPSNGQLGTCIALAALCSNLIGLYIEACNTTPGPLQPLLELPLTLTDVTLKLPLMQIDAVWLESLIGALRTAPGLRSLYLNIEQNHLYNAREFAILSPLLIPTENGLRRLYLGLTGCTWHGDIFLCGILPTLNNPCSLRGGLETFELVLEDARMSPRGIQEGLAPLLRLHPRLRCLVLQMSSNALGNSNVFHLLIQAITQVKHLRHLGLRVRSNNLRDRRCLHHLARCRELTSLSLDISCNPLIGQRTTQSLGSLLSQRPLTSLVLHAYDTELGDIRVRLPPHRPVFFLCHLFLGTPNTSVPCLLEYCYLPMLSSLHLNLNRAFLGDTGIVGLAHLLRSCGNLVNLTLRMIQNGIGDLGMQALCDSLCTSTNMRNFVLEIQSNRVSYRGFAAAMRMTSHWRHIQHLHLDLGNNDLDQRILNDLSVVKTMPEDVHVCIMLLEMPGIKAIRNEILACVQTTPLRRCVI